MTEEGSRRGIRPGSEVLSPGLCDGTQAEGEGSWKKRVRVPVSGSNLLGQAAAWSFDVTQGLLSVGPQRIYKIDICFDLYF